MGLKRDRAGPGLNFHVSNDSNITIAFVPWYRRSIRISRATGRVRSILQVNIIELTGKLLDGLCSEIDSGAAVTIKQLNSTAPGVILQ